VLLPLAQNAAAQPTGDPEHGKALWLETLHVECRDCHGENGEGGFGPDLAGRGLTRAQFIHAVRKPWGIMPAYAESQISDTELTDLIAYLGSLPGVDEPAPWRRQVPVGASPGLTAATTTGCTQCHHPLFNNGRAVMGAIDADFAWFRTIVYAHPAAYPPTRARLGEPPFERLAMGSFSPSRVPDSILQDIWTYIVDLGFRPRLSGQLSHGMPSADGLVYTLEIDNSGVERIGLAAEDLTVSLVVPSAASVVTASGTGYQGVSRDEEADADVAVWKVARIGPREHQTFTLTLSQAEAAEHELRGRIRWETPSVTTPFVNVALPARPGGGEAH
jgi:hypothetical protein